MSFEKREKERHKKTGIVESMLSGDIDNLDQEKVEIKLKEKELKSKSVNFRTYPSVYKAFKEKCNEQGASISELFDYFLKEVVEGRWKIDKPYD